MDIYVSHVHRKQIPSYLFPEGFRLMRSRRTTNKLGKTSPPRGRESSPKTCNGNFGYDIVEEFNANSAEKENKRKNDMTTDMGKEEKRVVVSPNDVKSASLSVSDVSIGLAWHLKKFLLKRLICQTHLLDMLFKLNLWRSERRQAKVVSRMTTN